MDILYAFKCKRFRNIRHIVTFGIQVSQDAIRVDFRVLRTKLSLSCSTAASETLLSEVKHGVFSYIMTVQTLYISSE
jgi:hypothetical protein